MNTGVEGEHTNYFIYFLRDLVSLSMKGTPKLTNLFLFFPAIDVQGILLQHGIIDAPSSTLGAFLLQQKKDREDYNDDSDEGGGDDGLDFGGMRKGKSIRDTKTRGKDADEGGDSDFDM